MPDRLIVATANPGKLREFRAMLTGTPGMPPFVISGLGELGLPSPPETGSTFAANALLKARAAAQAWAEINDHAVACAVADDSGLEVDALDGAPGIYSARYAGDAADDAANNAKLLQMLRTVPPSRRTARYRCALAFVRGALDPSPLIVDSAWEGAILEAPRGSGGFGYDAYFWIADLGRSAAELAAAEKNALSHRGKALRALLDLLKTGSELTPGTA